MDTANNIIWGAARNMMFINNIMLKASNDDGLPIEDMEETIVASYGYEHRED